MTGRDLRDWLAPIRGTRNTYTEPNDPLPSTGDETAKPKRLPSVKRVERESGKTVASYTVAVDGSRSFTFGQPGETKEAALTPLEEWKAKRRARPA